MTQLNGTFVLRVAALLGVLGCSESDDAGGPSGDPLATANQTAPTHGVGSTAPGAAVPSSPADLGSVPAVTSPVPGGSNPDSSGTPTADPAAAGPTGPGADPDAGGMASDGSSSGMTGDGGTPGEIGGSSSGGVGAAAGAGGTDTGGEGAAGAGTAGMGTGGEGNGGEGNGDGGNGDGGNGDGGETTGGDSGGEPQSGTMRVFYLRPTDVPFDQRYPDGITNVMHDAQDFFQAQLGETFRLNDPVVEVVEGDHEQVWYEETPNGDDRYWWSAANAQQEIQRRFDLPDNRWMVVSEVSAEGEGAGGGASGGWVLLPGHDADGAAGYPAQQARWVGGMVHELGHAFGLPDSSSTDGTCMSASFYEWPNCTFTDSQKSTMRNSAWGSGKFLF